VGASRLGVKSGDLLLNDFQFLHIYVLHFLTLSWSDDFGAETVRHLISILIKLCWL